MNAIILAAGKGTRLGAVTANIPKPLITISSLPIVEQQILYLLAAGITEVHVVVGYQHQFFFYLIEKYGVNIIYNCLYEKYNNLYSMSLAASHLGDTYVLEGDIWLNRNIFHVAPTRSTYFTGLKFKYQDEWVLEFSGNKLDNILLPNQSEPRNDCSLESRHVMSGVSYWSHEDSATIKTILESMMQNGVIASKYQHWYWDHLILNNLGSFSIDIQIINSEDWWEIDDISDLESARNSVFGNRLIHH